MDISHFYKENQTELKTVISIRNEENGASESHDCPCSVRIWYKEKSLQDFVDHSFLQLFLFKG